MNQQDGDRSLSLPESVEMPPRELAERIEGGEPLQVMDVRAPEKVEEGKIDLVPPERFHNTRGSELMHAKDIPSTGLDPELPVAVVCGHGLDSKILAFHLGRLGLDARSVAGGMLSWMRMTLPVELDPPEGLDRMVQLDRRGKGCLGYLLISQGEAVAVDPPLVFDSYEEILRDSGARLVAVADTHVHADYVSGAIPMSERFGVPYHLHPADAVYPYDGTPGEMEFRPIADGDSIFFGESALKVMHTPGHTEGSVTYLVEDRVALTGDFLFVESIGRPDLGGKEEEWAGQLWDSVARAIREWDDGVAVYPAHYAAENERRMGRAVGIPFGTLRRENELLRIQDSDVFVRRVLSEKAPFPEAYKRIKAINVGLAPIQEEEVEKLEVGRNECALGGAA